MPPKVELVEAILGIVEGQAGPQGFIVTVVTGTIGNKAVCLQQISGQAVDTSYVLAEQARELGQALIKAADMLEAGASSES